MNKIGIELSDMSGSNGTDMSGSNGTDMSGSNGTVGDIPVGTVDGSTPVVEVPVNNLALMHPKSTMLLVGTCLAIWIMAGLSMNDKKEYFITSGIMMAGVIVFVIITQYMSASYVIAFASLAFFCWFAWDTYKTYKKNGQQGMANVQVMLMVSLLISIGLGKFMMDRGDAGLPEIVSIFFTITSFSIIYLIHNLEDKACASGVIDGFDYETFAYHAVLYIVIFSLTGRHPMIALALSVASFAYFSYSAKKLKESEGYNTSTGQTSESTNIAITMGLIMYSVFKMIFPTFSFSSIVQAKPIVVLVNMLTICSILSFIVINVMFSSGASRSTMSGVLVGLNVIVGFWVFIRGFSN